MHLAYTKIKSVGHGKQVFFFIIIIIQFSYLHRNKLLAKQMKYIPNEVVKKILTMSCFRIGTKVNNNFGCGGHKRLVNAKKKTKFKVRCGSCCLYKKKKKYLYFSYRLGDFIGCLILTCCSCSRLGGIWVLKRCNRDYVFVFSFIIYIYIYIHTHIIAALKWTRADKA